jgi:hypothetical protein
MVRVGYVVDRAARLAAQGRAAGLPAVALVFVSYMTWAAGAYLWDGWRSEELTQGMIVMAVWIPQLSLPRRCGAAVGGDARRTGGLHSSGRPADPKLRAER